MRIVPAFGCIVDHDEVDDDRRNADSERGRADNRALFSKWVLPDKNLKRNDFDPQNPCTLKGLRNAPHTRCVIQLIPNGDIVVSFVISTFNRRDEMLHTLSRLRSCGIDRGQFETHVIDNASSDGTADAVAVQFPDVQLTRLAQNRGSCAKCGAVQNARQVRRFPRR